MVKSCITELRVEGKRAKTIVIYLDGREWARLDPETVVRSNLQVGEELSAERQAQVLDIDEAIRARRAAARHAAGGRKSELEMKAHLIRRGFHSPAIESALAALRETGTVDDATTAEQHTKRRLRGRYGPRRIDAELRARGIRPEEARQKLHAALEGVDLQAACLELARRVQTRFAPLDDPRQRRKLYQYLLRRGYDADLIVQALKILGLPDDEIPDGRS